MLRISDKSVNRGHKSLRINASVESKKDSFLTSLIMNEIKNTPGYIVFLWKLYWIEALQSSDTSCIT